MFIETERTPNPATLKFLPGRDVMASGTADFPDPETAQDSPLAAALFAGTAVSGLPTWARDTAATRPVATTVCTMGRSRNW